MNLADADDVGGVFFQLGPVRVHRHKQSAPGCVLEQFDDVRIQKRLAAAEQDGADVVRGQLIHEPFPVRELHRRFRRALPAVHVPLIAPLAAHFAPKVARVGQGEGYALRESGHML